MAKKQPIGVNALLSMLEQCVESIESTPDIDEAIRLYESAIGISRTLNEQLQVRNQQIATLTESAELIWKTE
ncbi:hypothetical protein EBR96_07610 [bacterium]|nr:hypothetical protein [bacterium]